MYVILKGLLGFIISFLITWYYLPLYIKKAKEKGIVGVDVNKPHHPLVAEMGGIIPVIAILLVLLIYLFLFPYFTSFIIVSGFLILANAFFGILDDILEFRYRDHILAMFLTSAIAILVLIKYTYLNTLVYIPFIGWVNFGILYWFLILLGFVFIPNAVNIYALFNGLEAGTAAILTIFFIACILLLHGPNNFAIALALAFLGALLGFLWYNKYPARVFPGDIGTLSFGAVLACIIVFGKIEFIACLMMIPYFLQFLLHIIRTTKKIKDSRHPIVLEDGKLLVPPHDPYKVMYLLLKIKPMTEKEAVKYLLLLQFIICLFVFGIVILSLAV